MKIDVKHIASLAKLKLDDEQIPIFEKQMTDILGMVEDLPEIDDRITIDAGDTMTLRPDEIQPSLRRDEVLQNAPKKQAGCIVVPKTVG